MESLLDEDVSSILIKADSENVGMEVAGAYLTAPTAASPWWGFVPIPSTMCVGIGHVLICKFGRTDFVALMGFQ